MKRVLCVWLPEWPLQKLRIEQRDENGGERRAEGRGPEKASGGCKAPENFSFCATNSRRAGGVNPPRISVSDHLGSGEPSKREAGRHSWPYGKETSYSGGLSAEGGKPEIKICSLSEASTS